MHIGPQADIACSSRRFFASRQLMPELSVECLLVPYIHAPRGHVLQYIVMVMIGVARATTSCHMGRTDES